MIQTTNLIDAQSLLSDSPSLKPGQNRTQSSAPFARDFSRLLRHKLGESRRCGQGKKAAETPAKTAGKPEPRDEVVNVKPFETGLKKESVEAACQEPTSETKISRDSSEKQSVEISLEPAVDQDEPSAVTESGLTTAEQSLMTLMGQILLELSGTAYTASGDEPAAIEASAADSTALKAAELPISANQPAANDLALTTGNGEPAVGETLLTGQRWARILEQIQQANMASAIPKETLQQLEKALTQLSPQDPTKMEAELPAMVAVLTTADTSTVDKDLRRLLSQMIKVMNGSMAAAESDCTITETAEPPSFDPLPQAVRFAESNGEKTVLNQQSPVFSGVAEKPTEVLKTAADQEMDNKDPQLAQVSEGKPLHPAGEGKTVVFDQGNGLFSKPVDENAALSGKNTADKTPALVKQMASGMRLIQREARTEMNIQLQPESLGKLNLKVAVENGLVTARLVAESQSVGRLIEGSLGQLKQALHEQGLRFDRIEVAVGESSVQPDPGQQFTRHQHSFTGSSNYAAFSTYPAEGEAQWEPYPIGPAVIEKFGSSGQIDFLA